MKRILSKGLVDINSRGKEHGRTPLMIAANGGYREIFDFLKGEGANMSQMDDDRNNILHLTCCSGKVEMARYIISQNIIDVNSRGKGGRTSVMIAALWGHIHVFGLLISKGANVSLVDQNSDNILHLATIRGHENIMKFVLSKDIAYIDSRGKFGRTPLMRAVYYGHIDAFDFLVCMQGNVSLLDDGNCSLLHLAITGGHVQMVEYLLSQDFEDMNSRWAFGRTSLMIAAYYGHREIFDLLVSKGSDVSHVDDNGDNILHRACIGGYVKMVRYLLSQEIVDINSRGRFGWTPLLIAAYFGHREVLSLLLNEGGDGSLVDSAGETILHLSSLKGHLKIVKYVLSHDIVDINNRNNKRNTAAMIAKQKGYHAIYDLLVARGSKAN